MQKTAHYEMPPVSSCTSVSDSVVVALIESIMVPP